MIVCIECEKEIKFGYFFSKGDAIACICKDCIWECFE